MPRTRPYTRKELESLRRADLQNLYKIHGLKGANQKSDVLLETLLGHFTSRSFVPPSSSPNKAKPYAPKGRPMSGKGPPAMVVKAKEVVRGVRPKTVEIDVVLPPVTGDEIRREDVFEDRNAQAGPSRSPSMRPAHEPVAPVSASHAQLPRRLSTVAVEQPETQSGFVTKEEIETLRTEVHSVRGAFDGVGGVSEERVRTMLRENNRTWEEQLRKSEQEWTKKVADLEEALKLRLRVLEEHIGGLSPPAGNAGVASTLQLSVQADLGRVPSLNLTSDTPSSHQFLGKRAHDTTNLAAYLAETPTADGIQNADINDSPVQKRARIEPAHLVSAQMEEDDSLIAIEPRTPSPPRMPTVSFKTPILPRTPSPSHQGVLPDNSMTPKVGSDYFANPPPFSVSGKKRKKSGPIEQLPYPIFSTTPKPTEPTSPTTDAPSSLSRGRNQGPTMLTPGRHRSEPATRAVSDAHKGLSSITESDEPRSEPAGMPSDTPTPTFLGPELGDPPASSPRLSASPTLRESAFAYHPFPANPSSRSFPAAVPRSRNRTSSSPARDYMSVALHGLNNPSDSPSAQATPGHRTMLGTERYRDTRFGDVPVFQWGTPSVDLGPRTPSLARRDS